jgi:hypothetical protein
MTLSIAAIAVGLLAGGCTNEESTPIDLDATTTTLTPPTLPDDDPNAQARNQVIEFAKEQCRLHPEREFGVVVIADSDGNEVNRYEYPCAELDQVGQE